MFPITNSFTYIALLMFVAGTLLALKKYAKLKIFNIVPPLICMYVVNMVLCTVGVYDMTDGSPTKTTYNNVMYNLLYAMIFVLLLQCDFRKLVKLGGRMFAIFLAGTVTVGIGFIVAYPLFMHLIGGGEVSWAAVSALYASWIAGSGAMTAVGAALGANEGAYACAMATDSLIYTVTVAGSIYAAKFMDKWNKKFKADTSKLEAIAKTANELTAGAEDKKPTGGDWVTIIGISLVVSAISQWAGGIIDGALVSMGITVLGKTTCIALFVTFAGLICAMTPIGKLPAISELSTVYMYAVVALMSSKASFKYLVQAPMWIIMGFVVVAIHFALMAILSKIFKWDMAMVVTASNANIGGVVSAPVVSAAYDPSYAGIGLLMGVLGAALGTPGGIAISFILRWIAGC